MSITTQTHHLIPQSWSSWNLWNLLGINIVTDADNLLRLASDAEDAIVTGLSKHVGSHAGYSDWVKARLQKIISEIDPNMGEAATIDVANWTPPDDAAKREFLARMRHVQDAAAENLQGVGVHGEKNRIIMNAGDTRVAFTDPNAMLPGSNQTFAQYWQDIYSQNGVLDQTKYNDFIDSNTTPQLRVAARIEALDNALALAPSADRVAMRMLWRDSGDFDNPGLLGGATCVK